MAQSPVEDKTRHGYEMDACTTHRLRSLDYTLRTRIILTYSTRSCTYIFISPSPLPQPIIEKKKRHKNGYLYTLKNPSSS